MSISLWTDDELQLLLEASLDFKSKCEFQGESWESKRSKYENILDIMLKQYPQNQEKYPNKDKLNKDRVAAKLKTIRTVYRKACNNVRISGGWRIVFTFYGLCRNLWRRSTGPVTKLKNLLDVHSILLGAVENDFQLVMQKERYEIASEL